MESDSLSRKGHLTPPVSERNDRQASNVSHGDMRHHVGVHPSTERAFNRAEAPVEVTHHESEPADDAAAQHRERLRNHAKR
jgi:hypothetical protein